jgi:hypothetical protein
MHVPGATIAAAAWLHLDVPASGAIDFVTGAAVGLSTGFVLWGLFGKDGAAA